MVQISPIAFGADPKATQPNTATAANQSAKSTPPKNPKKKEDDSSSYLYWGLGALATAAVLASPQIRSRVPEKVTNFINARGYLKAPTDLLRKGIDLVKSGQNRVKGWFKKDPKPNADAGTGADAGAGGNAGADAGTGSVV